MSRPLRIEYPGALYHVVSHGNGRLWLFKHDDGYSMFLDILGEYIKKYHVVIHNFVIMRNHFHLVVETKSANLGLFMNQVLRDYAMYFNRVSRRRGSNGCGVKSRNLTNATKGANGIILLKLGETETKRKGETVASQMKKLPLDTLLSILSRSTTRSSTSW